MKTKNIFYNFCRKLFKLKCMKFHYLNLNILVYKKKKKVNAGYLLWHLFSTHARYFYDYYILLILFHF